MQDINWRKPKGLPTIDGFGTQFVAALQIAGGLSGIVMALLTIGGQPMTMMMYLLLGPFVVGTLSGIGLLRRTRMSLLVSRVLWAAQIPVFTGPFLTYSLALGLGLIVGHLNGGILFNFPIGAEFNFHLFYEEFQFGLGLNLLAIPVLRYLLKIPLDSVSKAGTNPAIFDQVLGTTRQESSSDSSGDQPTV